MSSLFPKVAKIKTGMSSSDLSTGMRSIIDKSRKLIEIAYSNPTLLMDAEIIKLKVQAFINAMPRVKPHYAVKANPDAYLLKVLEQQDASFEVASDQEINLLDRLNLLSGDVHFSNPVKSERAILNAINKGIKWFTVDSKEELLKIFRIFPQAKLSLRIDVPNEGSDWPLTGKFGAKMSDVKEIIRLAARVKARLQGVSFHVGSQCRNPNSWKVAIDKAKYVMGELDTAGLRVSLLNIGGGFPVTMTIPVPEIEVIGDIINREILSLDKDLEIIAEPGRFLVADAGCLISQVIGTTSRDNVRWAYLDTGVFGGLLESSQGLSYKMFSNGVGRLVPWTIAGPTCDAVDVLPVKQLLPERLQTGDYIYILNAGAYTSVYASNFNGFSSPLVKFL